MSKDREFSTLCRRQRNLDVRVAYRSSEAGLHLLVDTTGSKFLGEGEWKCKQHGPERRMQSLRSQAMENWSDYHRRSLVESKMNCTQQLGERVMSSTLERQVNELHIHAAILHRFTELGHPKTVTMAMT